MSAKRPAKVDSKAPATADIEEEEVGPTP